MMITHPPLLFDLDGTLANPRHGILRCLRHAVERLGAPCPSDAELEQYIGPPLITVFESLLGANGEHAEAIRLFRGEYATTGLFEAELYPGIADALQELANRGRTMYVATSKPHVYATRILERFGLDRFFRAIYGCELSGERANKAELLAHLLEREAFDDAIMIGDRHHDIAAARANGLRSIGVTWGFGSADELRDAGADVICVSPADLIRAV